MKLKLWELCLIVGLFAALMTGALAAEGQKTLSETLIRLHVVANSDSKEDQALKLAVRDAVLLRAEAALAESGGRADAEAALAAVLPELEAAAAEVIAAWGHADAVSAELTFADFPERRYDTFALPAGTYRALRVTIGEGAGRNWWCVVFPPLCMGAAADVGEAAAAGGLSEEQVLFITEDGPEYEFAFRSLEIFQGIKDFFAWE